MNDNKTPKILQVGSVKKNKTSGLSFSIPGLLKGLKENKINADFLNTNNNGFRLDLDGINIKDYGIIVLNSFFVIQHLLILLRASNAATIIITPRGGFTNKNEFILKKRIYSFFYFQLIRFRKLKTKIHYLTQAERDNSRFKNIPYFIVGNSVQSNDIIEVTSARRSFEKTNIVYMGRFNTYIKGLDILQKHIVRHNKFYRSNGVTFHLYGPDSKDKNLLVKFFESHDIDNVFFHDPVYGEEKMEILDKADFHIMTSRSEGFPMAVLESLARGCPQILSEGTNMLPLLQKFEFGFEFDDHLPKKILTLNSENYRTMVENAITCAKEHSSKNVALATYKEYIK